MVPFMWIDFKWLVWSGLVSLLWSSSLLEAVIAVCDRKTCVKKIQTLLEAVAR